MRTKGRRARSSGIDRLPAGTVTACLLLVLPTCGSGGGQLPAIAAFTGCYRFVETEEAAALGLPWGIELLPDSLTGWGVVANASIARTWLSPVEVADHPFGYWTVVEGDSIRVGHPGGGGFDLVLGSSDGNLAGRGRAVGGAVSPTAPAGPPPSHPVRAIRTSCPG